MSLRVILSRVRWVLAAACRVRHHSDPPGDVTPRYLEGELSAEWTATLDEQLKRDSALRRQFAQMLLSEQQLRQIGRERWVHADNNFEDWSEVQV